MPFTNEADFENSLINLLPQKGWETDVLKNYTQDDLLKNWANILFDNNRDIDRLNDCPLTETEMAQIMEQITNLKTPLKLNGFINGKTVFIIRDNPQDTLHIGKEISLKIYDRHEIAAGKSRYQIAQQPRFTSKSSILNNRRGDLMLLINGMPVIHIELKKSGIPVSQATRQIDKYASEGIFSGLFSLVQVFVAMTPEQTVYFANPGPDGTFNPDYYFNWANFNNEPINNWSDIATSLLSIPMAHQLIGFYTVADDTDGILKVMRSYQYYAANAISDKVSKTEWNKRDQRGGYIWHTTGSGKTMTSFKSAQLIANSKDADKVIFLMDRIELGTQSLKEYRAFADENESVQATENTASLITKLKSKDSANTLIVTSIQKMSNIQNKDELKIDDIEIINTKRIVFIVDEAHRSTFGEMLVTIKKTFPKSIFFGFTGTPIQDENQKKMSTTTSIFGNELHRYSIADGIRDKNVLGFDPYKVLTYKDIDIKKAVALTQAKAQNEQEALDDPKKSKVYYEFMNCPMVNIEEYLPTSQYQTDEHQNKVVEDISENFLTLSRNYNFHSLFATSSITEAIIYYRLFKTKAPTLKTTCLFDPNIDNNEGFAFKEDGLVEIITDYNTRYNHKFSLSTHALFKKDIANRLAHKAPYIRLERTPNQQIDILIVVDQMLTGFDSKWINTLYLDKKLEYENIIQAFSRTNRLFGQDKPFGTIRYYRKPHTMEQNIIEAVKLYSGDKPLGLFVPKLESNLKKLNSIYGEIAELFTGANVFNFEKLPQDIAEQAKFASLFRKLNELIEAAKIQGYSVETTEYNIQNESENQTTTIIMDFDEIAFFTLAIRYKELGTQKENTTPNADIPFDLVGYLTQIDTGVIDSNYMNSRFNKYLKLLTQEGTTEEDIENALNDLHKTFATLTQEEQKYANLFLHDIQRGDAKVEQGLPLRDYIYEYMSQAKNDQIQNLVTALGVDITALEDLLSLKLTQANLNGFGRFDQLKNTVDKTKAKTYFEKLNFLKNKGEDTPIPPFKINIKIDTLLRNFILQGGFEIEKF